MEALGGRLHVTRSTIALLTHIGSTAKIRCSSQSLILLIVCRQINDEKGTSRNDPVSWVASGKNRERSISTSDKEV